MSSTSVSTGLWAKYPAINQVKRTLKVVCIGAGASGLLVAYKLQKHFDNLDLTIFEKNPDISGTWFENRYPGCACDVPAHCYTFSFEPKPDWNANYASSWEIHRYFTDFATKYRLGRFIKLNHKVVGAIWSVDRAEWDVCVEDLTTRKNFTVSCHCLVNAGGILNVWKYPPIPGLLDKFQGTVVHSAAFPEDLDVNGKVVGLIGNGSSGIQILPAIAPQVAQLKTFIREATWVSPPAGEEFRTYSDEDKARFASDPDLHLQVRKHAEEVMNSQFSLFHRSSEAQNQIRAYMVSEMKRKINNAKLEKVLIPEWSVGCRRLTPGPNYLESLSRDNVEVAFGEITHVSEKGPVLDDGSEHPVEVLICATGFDTTFKPRFPLVGDSGKELASEWKDEPEGYLGIAVPGYQNYFMLLGPNCPAGNGPLLIAVEAQVDYLVKMLSRFQKENWSSFEVKVEPTKDFNEWKNEYMKLTIWTEECRSWYKSGSTSGNVVALWPGSTLHYLEAVKDVRWEDWDIKHQPGHNRWEFLGNGHSTAEARTRDLSYYIRQYDDEPVDPCLKATSQTEEAASAKSSGPVMFERPLETKL
ncbi:hypothetical protein Z517_06836 [Fonsecaea pedrosoi CBS 271.37]|uniref:FAD/NAD(P)-binding domain-containing protein n=1 Tax=Fonsecaea pedrosoi CBS 271.37 TaxID=1442368 RepID=A0A0D2DQW6_9EURO|nr:uncharacterized protein Z517_06836 [Fonsecaea pedrosoi CBS 271.37]KIW80221.1 hypothetical protein Z517_06836 [Fonsecaea pedrosoi CBS 271.37]